MAEKINKEALYQHWLHAWEEDTATQQVFRPATYDFQLSRRPRESFELKPNGTLVKGEPGAADRPEEATGTWELLEEDQLAFYREAGSTAEPAQKLRITSVSEDRLVVKPES